MNHQFEALGTTWWITVYDELDTETLKGAFGTLERFAREYEAQYSRFKDDSLVSIINRERALEAPSAECRALLAYGKELYLRTNTYFNFLTGHLQEARGYDAQYSFTPQATEPPPPGNPITDLLILENRIELKHGNIDLGGYGKGYLIDELATILIKMEVRYFLINGGGDMYATSDHDKPIEVYLEHPTKPRHFIHRTTLLNHGFASSSPYKRIWHTDQGTFSHVMANKEAPRIASFIKAPTARDADAFATVALVVTEQELQQFAKDEELAAMRFSPATNQLWRTIDFDTFGTTESF